MKYIVRLFLFHAFGLWLTSQLLPGLVILGNWQVVLFAGFILGLLHLIVTPILKILFIPINLLTFGLLAWFIYVIVFYLLTVFVPEVNIVSWDFPGMRFSGFVVPGFHLSYFWALVATSLLVTFIANILHWASEN